MIRVGPGSPATWLIEPFAVGGTQNVAAPTGKFASAEPCATIGSRKHLRRSTSVQLPLSGLFAEQSELLRQLTMPVPSGRTRPSQVFSSGPVAHCASSVPGIASQTPPLH